MYVYNVIDDPNPTSPIVEQVLNTGLETTSYLIDIVEHEEEKNPKWLFLSALNTIYLNIVVVFPVSPMFSRIFPNVNPFSEVFGNMRHLMPLFWL
jgi:hypothetical protein